MSAHRLWRPALILSDFQISAEDGYSDDRAVNLRANHITEAIRMELARRPRIDAPFRKMVIDLYEPVPGWTTRPVVCCLGVAEARAEAAERDLLGSHAAFRAAVFAAVREAVARLERALGWRSDAFDRIIDDLERRDDLYEHRLESLSKKRIPGGGSVDIIYRMTETETVLKALVRDKGGALVREEVIAREGMPLGLDFFFDVRSTLIKAGQLLLRDRDKKVIGRLSLKA